MHLKILHSGIGTNSHENGLVRSVFSSRPIAGVLHDALCDAGFMGDGARLAVPENWDMDGLHSVVSFGKKVPLNVTLSGNSKQNHFIVTL